MLSNREEFIAALIAELESQKEKGIFDGNPLSAADVFKKICYDFPEVAADAQERLSVGLYEMLEELSNGNSLSLDSKALYEVWTVNHKFLENVSYMCVKRDNSESEGEAAVTFTDHLSLLYATLYIKFAKVALNSGKTKLGKFFSVAADGKGDYENITPLTTDAPVDSISWIESFTRFRDFFIKSNASLMTSLDTNMFIRRNYLGDLFDIVKTLGACNGMLSTQELSVTVMGRATMRQLLYTVSEVKCGRLDKAMADPDIVAACSDEDVDRIIAIAKEAWVHGVFLARDIMISLPGLIPQSLPKFCDSLLLRRSEGSGRVNNGRVDGDDFPTSSECLLVLTLSALSDSLSRSDIDRRGNPQTQQSERVRVFALKALKSYVSTKLNDISGICERMISSATDNAAEAISILCSISSIFLPTYIRTERVATTYQPLSTAIDADVASIAHAHEMLISSRVLPSLAQYWVKFVTTEPIEASMRTVISSVFAFLAQACLESATTAQFLLYIPSFREALIHVCRQAHHERPLNSSCPYPTSFPSLPSPEDDAVDTERAVIKAGDAVLMLVAIAASAFHAPGTTLTATSSASVRGHREEMVWVSPLLEKLIDAIVSKTTAAMASLEYHRMARSTAGAEVVTSATIEDTAASENITEVEKATDKRRLRVSVPAGLRRSLSILNDFSYSSVGAVRQVYLPFKLLVDSSSSLRGYFERLITEVIRTANKFSGTTDGDNADGVEGEAEWADAKKLAKALQGAMQDLSGGKVD